MAWSGREETQEALVLSALNGGRLKTSAIHVANGPLSPPVLNFPKSKWTWVVTSHTKKLHYPSTLYSHRCHDYILYTSDLPHARSPNARIAEPKDFSVRRQPLSLQYPMTHKKAKEWLKHVKNHAGTQRQIFFQLACINGLPSCLLLT